MKATLESRFKDSKPLYSESEAKLEANRCLFCYDAPCIKACPVSIDIPEFIKKIASGNIRGAAKTILHVNPLGLSTSRVCPVEELCAGACVFNQHHDQPIQIGRLQRYAVEHALRWEMNSGKSLFKSTEKGNRKVALIGAGPASVSCAAYLAMAGIHPVIYEKENTPGGLNATGIAPYKLHSPDAIAEIEWISRLGIEIKTGVTIGVDVSVDQLLEDYHALFVGTGLGKDKFAGIQGETEPGVWGATELIRRIKMDDHFRLPDDLNQVIIIGGGNTALDIAHELALLGVQQVDIIYRRTSAEMPGYRHELIAARKSGARMMEKLKPVKIEKTVAEKLSLITEHTISGEQVRFDADWIVMAIGQENVAGKLIPQLQTDPKGRILVDPVTRRTSHPKIYAGGDCINGGKEVVNAVADGREAAYAMLKEFEMK
ncbi:MAG: FAD-dependent oxidoreductase [Fidelibacterota bacterium]